MKPKSQIPFCDPCPFRDVAISVAQLVPKSEIIVVTTPQISAAEVSVRAGTLAKQTHQRVVGVI